MLLQVLTVRLKLLALNALVIEKSIFQQNQNFARESQWSMDYGRAVSVVSNLGHFYD